MKILLGVLCILVLLSSAAFASGPIYKTETEFYQSFDNFTNSWWTSGHDPNESVDSGYGVTCWMAIDDDIYDEPYNSKYPSAADSQLNGINPATGETVHFGLFYATNTTDSDKYNSRGFYTVRYPKTWWDQATGGPIYYNNPLFDNLAVGSVLSFDLYDSDWVNFNPYIEIKDIYGNVVKYDSASVVGNSEAYYVDIWNFGEPTQINGLKFNFDLSSYSSITYADGYDASNWTITDLFENTDILAIYAFDGNTLDNSYKTLASGDSAKALASADGIPGLYYLDNVTITGQRFIGQTPEPSSIALGAMGFVSLVGLKRRIKK